ncbi:MAG TPA: RDD family protein [Alphaproteobacteria bacterium]|nr:RDD family protein [Alphaproteobacteria bacterium]
MAAGRDAVAAGPRPDYAPFWRRVAALAIDAIILSAAVVGIVYAANAAAAGFDVRLFDPFWETPEPVRRVVESAGERRDVQEGGVVIENRYSRETRIYADGGVRIFAVIDGTTQRADGQIDRARVEMLIGRNRSLIVRQRLTQVLCALLPFVYFLLMESSARQASFGKRALGIKVTDAAGRRLGLGRAAFRQLMKATNLFSTGITYLIAAFTERRQALHDMFAGTLVLRA